MVLADYVSIAAGCVENLIIEVFKCSHGSDCWIIPLYLNYCANP